MKPRDEGVYVIETKTRKSLRCALSSMNSSLRPCQVLSESELSQHCPTLHGFMLNHRPHCSKNTALRAEKNSHY